MQTIDVKAAVAVAIDYLKFLQDEISNEIQDVRLEEVELSEDKKYWLITLGYDIPIKNLPVSIELIFPNTPAYKREYKLFKVNSKSSQVEAMKIREV